MNNMNISEHNIIYPHDAVVLNICIIYLSISLQSLSRLHLQVTGASPSVTLYHPDSFITVTRARAKVQLREQSIHLVSLLLSSCGAGEGQSGAEGISKPLCHLDLSVTLFPFSKVFLSLLLHTLAICLT